MVKVDYNTLKRHRRETEANLYTFLYLGAKRGWGCERQAPNALPWERNTLPILKKAEIASGSVWRGEEYLALTTVRTVDRPSSTDYSIPAASIQRHVD